jgi:mono/diheme cytochrome c family protein
MAAGESLYVAHCQGCHGTYALGTKAGPPLVHGIYLAPHHADAAFVLAVRNGVRAHHWTFGDMPPVPEVDEDGATRITAYLRWLQGESEYR